MKEEREHGDHFLIFLFFRYSLAIMNPKLGLPKYKWNIQKGVPWCFLIEKSSVCCHLTLNELDF